MARRGAKKGEGGGKGGVRASLEFGGGEGEREVHVTCVPARSAVGSRLSAAACTRRDRHSKRPDLWRHRAWCITYSASRWVAVVCGMEGGGVTASVPARLCDLSDTGHGDGGPGQGAGAGLGRRGSADAPVGLLSSHGGGDSGAGDIGGEGGKGGALGGKGGVGGGDKGVGNMGGVGGEGG